MATIISPFIPKCHPFCFENVKGPLISQKRSSFSFKRRENLWKKDFFGKFSFLDDFHHSPIPVSLRFNSPVASLSNPKGFGPPKPKKNKNNKTELEKKEEDSEFKFQSSVPEIVEEDEAVPEQVTNRILKRLLFTIGFPLFIGLSAFPLFYWLKVVQKVDLPEWVPYITSIVCFGSAGLGISYGVISTSWDPNREGTLLGWKEAKANWPVLMENMNKKK